MKTRFGAATAAVIVTGAIAIGSIDGRGVFADDKKAVYVPGGGIKALLEKPLPGVEGRVPQVDIGHAPLKRRDGDPIVVVEGLVKQDQDAGEHVRDDVLECEPEREAGQPQPGHEGGDVDARGAQRGHQPEDQHDVPDDPREKPRQVLVKLARLAEAQHDLIRREREQPEDDEDKNAQREPREIVDEHAAELVESFGREHALFLVGSDRRLRGFRVRQPV